MNYDKAIEAIDSAENEIKDAESEFTHHSEAEEVGEFYDLKEGRRLLTNAIRYLTDALAALDEDDKDEDNEEVEGDGEQGAGDDGDINEGNDEVA